MRSRLHALLLLLGTATAILRCDSQSSRIFDVCETLARCTGYLNQEQCSGALDAAIADQRVTTSAVTGCAQCLGNHSTSVPDNTLSVHCTAQPWTHNPCASASSQVPRAWTADGHVVHGAGAACEQLLNGRACDTACSDVSLVLRARTSSGMRGQMCSRAASCADDFAGPECSDAAAHQLSCRPLELQLEADADVDACEKCLLDPQDSAGGKGDQPPSQFGRGAVCELMVDACSEVCRKTAASVPLNLAAQIARVCSADACFTPAAEAQFGPNAAEGGAAPDDSVGGASVGGASAGEGGADDSGRTRFARQPCFERVMTWLSDPKNAPRALCTECSSDAAGGAASRGHGSTAAGGETVDDCNSDRTAPRSQVAICAACVANKDCPSVTAPCAQACKKLPLGIVP